MRLQQQEVVYQQEGYDKMRFYLIIFILELSFSYAYATGSMSINAGGSGNVSIINGVSSVLTGTQTWTGTNIFVGSTSIKGTTTNTNASTGYIGEYVESVVGNTNFPSSGVIGDLTSISLTAGDWDVTIVGDATRNGATWTVLDFAITSTSGNSTTGRVVGSNWFEISGTFGAIFDTFDTSIANYRVSINSTTTYYYKYMSIYSVATPTLRGRLSARRIR